jgi:hypothetical protein
VRAHGGKVLAARHRGDRRARACQRCRDKRSDGTRANDAYAHVESLEATGRFELPNGAFAEPCLTTWLRRRACTFVFRLANISG